MNLTLRLSYGLLSLQNMVTLFHSDDMITMTQKDLQTITVSKSNPNYAVLLFWIKNWGGENRGQVIDLNDFMLDEKKESF